MRNLRNVIWGVLAARDQKDSATVVTRREAIQRSAALGLLGASSLTLSNRAFAGLSATGARNDNEEGSTVAKPLTPPAHGSIPVAFLVSEGAVMIDFAGPWEVFLDAVIPGRSDARDNRRRRRFRN
jgi:hypothetical protein